METIYRIESVTSGGGMWYNGLAEYTPFDDEFIKGVPMDWDAKYGFDGPWHSAVYELENLTDWFPVDVIEKLLSSGYVLCKYTVSHIVVDGTQILFRKADVVDRVEIDYKPNSGLGGC